jgi:DNA-binding MarR family transcriptional regulator
MANDEIPDQVARRLGYALKRAQHALRSRMDETLRPLGLTTAQYAVLCVIEQNGGISNAGLARAAFVTPQTMTGIISNLSRAGLLAREADPFHGRILKSALTPKGEKLLSKAHHDVGNLEAILLKAVGKGNASQLAKLLSQCADDLST